MRVFSILMVMALLVVGIASAAPQANPESQVIHLWVDPRHGDDGPALQNNPNSHCDNQNPLVCTGVTCGTSSNPAGCCQHWPYDYWYSRSSSMPHGRSRPSPRL